VVISSNYEDYIRKGKECYLIKVNPPTQTW
jgi:hypothetical protein